MQVLLKNICFLEIAVLEKTADWYSAAIAKVEDETKATMAKASLSICFEVTQGGTNSCHFITISI